MIKPVLPVTLALTLGACFTHAENLKAKIGYSEEELLDGLVPVPIGLPNNDPQALPLINGCPRACAAAGSDAANWTQLYKVSHLEPCNSTLLFEFNVQNDPSPFTTIRACYTGSEVKDASPKTQRRSYQSSGHVEEGATSAAKQPLCGAASNVTSEVNVSVGIDSIASEMRPGAAEAVAVLASHLSYHAPCGSTIIFAKSGEAIVGLYIGADLQKSAAVELLPKLWYAELQSLVSVSSLC